MNERIKLLKEQAMGWVPNMADPDTKIRLLNAEKFAELIIGHATECVRDVLRDENSDLSYDAASQVQNRIKEYFGVEEQEKVAPNPKCSVCGTTENVRYMGGYQPYLCDSVDCIPF